jgi:Tfp pilus assembly protein FimT
LAYLALVLILIGGALELPSIERLQHRVRLHRCALNWMHELRRARIMAMIRHQTVKLCVHASGDSCSQASSGGQSELRLLATDRVIWRGGRLCAASRSTWPARHILFNALGETNGRQGRWVLSDRDGEYWQIILIRTGRLRLAHGHVKL